ncbi:unnamed protein product [Sphagnum jensenii]|uniref:Uncharacterized protein n=1 Tax=Sphagnum jensenii TaxID=128206 RepID=A0ABP1AVQ8_9BRYO
MQKLELGIIPIVPCHIAVAGLHSHSTSSEILVVTTTVTQLRVSRGQIPPISFSVSSTGHHRQFSTETDHQTPLTDPMPQTNTNNKTLTQIPGFSCDTHPNSSPATPTQTILPSSQVT